MQKQAQIKDSSWIEISASALVKNIQNFKKTLGPSVRLGAVLKGDAYGHGLRQVCPVVHSYLDSIYLISAKDAFWIRHWEKENKKRARRLVVMGVVSESDVVWCARDGIEVVMGGPEWKDVVKILRRENVRLKTHIHLDTGLSREGFVQATLAQDLAFIRANSKLFDVVGVMSHFANTEDVTEQAYAKTQLRNFAKMGAEVKKVLGLSRPLEEHIGATAAALVLPESRLTTMRIGIGLYGIWPSTEARISAKLILKKPPKLIPVLTWKCRSQTVKWIPKGSYVGYGCTHRCNQDTRIAVFPVGYYDGYPRLLSGKAHVLVNLKRCPVLGRVMMNHIIVDVTQASFNGSDCEAVLLGEVEHENLPAELLATWAQTIHYEIVTRLGSHLPRVVVD